MAFITSFAATGRGACEGLACAARPVGSMTARSSSQLCMAHTFNGMAIEKPLKAVRNNLLIKLAEPPAETAGGLILATEAQEKPNYGVAVSVGEGAYFPSGGKIEMGDLPVAPEGTAIKSVDVIVRLA